MAKKRSSDIVRRWEGNPIIGMRDLGFRCSDICNAGAAKLDGEYILLVTIQDLEGSYCILPARGTDGYRFEVGAEPFLMPSTRYPYTLYEEHGVQDARISRVEGDYFVSYDAISPHGFRLGLAKTRDFSSVERVGLLSEPDTKGGVLFPRRMDGVYVRLERPWEGGSIWISYSEDLEFWGGSEVVLTPRGGYWDAHRVGVAAPPMEIDAGWLLIYYGVKHTSAGPLFRLGAAILDKDDPKRLVGRTNIPILSPRELYERIGDIGNLVFCCGAIIEPDDEVKIYYGASNSCICVGVTTVNEIVDTCLGADMEF